MTPPQHSTRNRILRMVPFVLSLLTPIAYAATCPAGQYSPIAPFGTISGCLNLTQYLNQVFTTTIGIAGILAVVIIVVCAVRMMTTGSVAGRSEAKECIYNAIFGVLIAIGSWLLLNTINPQLLKNDAVLAIQAPTQAPAAGVQTANDPMPTQPAGAFYYRYRDATLNIIKNSPSFPTIDVCNASLTKQKDGGVTIENGPDGNPTCFRIPPATLPPAGSGEDATRNQLCGNNSCLRNTTSNSNVYVKKPPCIPYTANYKQCATGTGTNVGGLPLDAVNHLKNLAANCPCSILITGGTEAGHVSHGANVPVFDLSRSADLLKFIKTNATVKENPSFCSPSRKNGVCFYKWLYNGYWYTDEVGAELYGIAPHWHVCKDGTPPDLPTPEKIAVFGQACNKI